MQTHYFLKLKSGRDLGLTVTEARDVFLVVTRSGLPLFEITLLDDLRATQTMSCKSLDGAVPTDLLGIADGFTLCALVLQTLTDLRAWSAAEFYADIFEAKAKYFLWTAGPKETENGA